MILNNFIEKRFFLFVLSIPFIEFINKNFNDITREIFLFFFIYSTLILIVVLFICYFANNFFDKENKNKFNFLLSISFFVFFKFEFFKSFLTNYNISYDGEISLLIILIIIFIFFILNSYSFISKLLKIFLLSYFFIISFQLVYSFFQKDYKNSDISLKSQSYFSQNQLDKIKDKRNIYYVVVDGMTSLTNFEEKFSEKNNLFRSFIKEKNLNYYDTNSAYTSTLTSFTSVLNLNYTYNEAEELFDRSKMFPETMKPHIVNNYPLFQILKSLEINFFWEGVPHPGSCVQYNLDFCLDNKKKNRLVIFYDRFKMNRFILFAFLKNTPVESIMYRFNLFKKYRNHYPQFEENNSIDKFITKMNNFDYNKKSNFFLIHHLSPHEPFIYKKDCSYQDHKKSLKIYPEGYKDAYQCVLKKIMKLVEFVEKKDPKAVLVIQGDHGGGFGKSDLEIQQDILKTFTLLKKNKTNFKNFDLSNKLDMVNTARLLLSCATNQEPNLLEKKSYLKINDRLVEY